MDVRSGRRQDRWYLGTDAEVVVPEVAAYATLPAIGLETARASQQAIFGHLDSMRGLHGCDRGDAPKDSSKRSRGCEGVWITANGTESRVGANPGYAYSGDAYGLYVGADGTVHTDARGEVRLGGFAGLARGNYWTTGASSGPGASSDSNVRLDGPVFGMYGELRARSGAYASATLLHQDNDAQILTDDGFRQAVAGDSISLVHQLGWQLAVQDGWSLEPQVQVGVTQVHWKDAVDAGGKALDFDDDTSGHLRAALRVERALLSDAGAWRPWFTLGIEDTIGESHSAVSASEVALAGEDLGQRWTLDAGIEAALHNGWSLFGSVGVAREINGTSTETRQARVGARWDW